MAWRETLNVCNSPNDLLHLRLRYCNQFPGSRFSHAGFPKVDATFAIIQTLSSSNKRRPWVSWIEFSSAAALFFTQAFPAASHPPALLPSLLLLAYLFSTFCTSRFMQINLQMRHRRERSGKQRYLQINLRFIECFIKVHLIRTRVMKENMWRTHMCLSRNTSEENWTQKRLQEIIILEDSCR